MHGLKWFALGASTAAVVGAAGGPLAKALRPAAKSALKGGIVLSRETQRRAAEARATFDDLLSEANSELDAGDGSAQD